MADTDDNLKNAERLSDARQIETLLVKALALLDEMGADMAAIRVQEALDLLQATEPLAGSAVTR